MILSMENVENEQHQVRYISTQTGFCSAQGKSGGKPSVGRDKPFRSERQAHHLSEVMMSQRQAQNKP